MGGTECIDCVVGCGRVELHCGLWERGNEGRMDVQLAAHAAGGCWWVVLVGFGLRWVDEGMEGQGEEGGGRKGEEGEGKKGQGAVRWDGREWYK